MGVSVKVTSDLKAADSALAKATTGDAAGRVCALAARTAMDKHVRKDTGQLAGSAQTTAWRVVYPLAYASIVWDVPPRIVSPRNPYATARPEQQPDVAAKVAEQMALYLSRL